MITLTREEAQQVLDALDSKYIVNCGAWRVQRDAAIETLRARLSAPELMQLGEIMPADEEQLKRIAKLVEPEPEPMACIVKDCENHKHQGRFVGDLCSPCHAFITRNEGKYSQAYRNAQREWQGLTDEEKNAITWGKTVYEILDLAEAKLREKNT